MRRTWAILFLSAAAALIGACGNQDGLFGAKPAPDEFAVYSRAPLAMPPDFALRPPAPGTQRPQDVIPRERAEKALLGNPENTNKFGLKTAEASPGGSPGVQALLKDTGGLKADPKIRATITSEMSIMSQGDKGFTERLLSWTRKNNPEQAGIVINPDDEARRIKENQAQGRPITATPPPAAPTITRRSAPKSKGFWGSLF
ncbi:MAG: hypothetical protein A3G18_04215 [Rhodospirillales bacterium RIFCSPLOWO2_12_FULL_58_28]|nr:MAG: hypothetical protein A3H92_05095 [Rhodospirillales bacterium RIFCSPLOWO2_02_FULL_58_16]OHC78723.1 MAG: hypothetical protein A3G18_04215 [Rhodospirillales bacterium RIFCSPLOWO2_12_FULL_58_28]